MLGSLLKSLLGSRAVTAPRKETIDARWLEETLRLQQQGAQQEVVGRCHAALEIGRASCRERV